MKRDEMVDVFGFAPEAVSQTVRSFGIIEQGARKGYLCVFTEDIEPDEHATMKPNFADVDRGYDVNNAQALVYIFAPREREREVRVA